MCVGKSTEQHTHKKKKHKNVYWNFYYLLFQPNKRYSFFPLSCWLWAFSSCFHVFPHYFLYFTKKIREKYHNKVDMRCCITIHWCFKAYELVVIIPFKKYLNSWEFPYGILIKFFRCFWLASFESFDGHGN